MYLNYFRYGNVEVANNQRVFQYTQNGLKPTGAVIGDCDECEDLAYVTDGTTEYRTPELDSVPWVSGPDFDAPDFAGVRIQEVTGIEGSTATVTVDEKIGDGGQIGTRRSGSRTIAVTADVVGRTSEAASLGLEWLSAQLHPPCSEGGDCTGETLHMFTTCPVSCVGLTDPDSAIVTTQYDTPASFQTTAIVASPAPQINFVDNPSAENGATGFASSTAFGAYIAGTVTAAAPPVALLTGRTNAFRLSMPALALAQRTNITSAITVAEAGTYELSAWVYVPAATTVEVRMCDIFVGGGPYTAVKDRWIRLTYRNTYTAGATVNLTVDTKDADAAKASGMLIWVDAWSLKKIPSFASSANNQGSLITDVEGWYNQPAFGNFTTPAAIEVVAFPSPNPTGSADNPRSIRVTWKATKDVGTIAHAVYNGISGITPGVVYTIECDIYMTAGSASFEADGLFNGKGMTVTTKGSWQHIKHTFTTPNTSMDFGFTSLEGENMSGAGQYMYIANLQISHGFGVEPIAYFDGALQDATATNLAAGIVPTVTNGTLALNQQVDGVLWTKVNQGTGATLVRTTIPLANLTSRRRYVASWLVYNPHQTKSKIVAVDWADAGTRTYTLAPLEIRRIYSIARPGLDATFRFADISITSTSDNVEPIYFRDVQVYPADLNDYSWAGTADNSDSVATPTGSDFIFKPDAGDSELFGPTLPAICDNFEVTWTVSSPTGALVTAWASAATPDGVIISDGAQVVVSDVPTDIVIKGVQSPNFPDNWRPVLTTNTPLGQGYNGRQVTVHSLTVKNRPILTVEECVRPYRRTLHNVVTVEGPKVVEWLTFGDTTEGSSVARVEWTWVGTDPFLWHDPVPILTSVTGGVPAYRAPGVNVGSALNAPVNTTACARPALTALTCADNTLGPGIILPPQAPVIVDTSVMNLAGKNRTRVPFEIPTTLAPVGLGKLSWTFVNDAKPKFGIRVRIYEDADPAFNVSIPLPNECSFVQEFTIEYLAPNQTLYIEGPGDAVYVTCGVDAFGNTVYADALKNVRGNYGGPFKNDWIGCGKAYYVSVDTPNVYSATPSNLSGLGNDTTQGSVVWSVDLVRRA
jgi:hypothetical protein